MSWSAELWHLLQRDVRRTAWLLLVYVVLLALAVVKATQSVSALSGNFAPVGQAVLLLMPLLVALTVHADSAVRVDAFWAVQPVRTSALVTSKLLFLLLLLALWALAAGVVMCSWQLLSVAALADIGLVDIFATFALLLLGTALVSAGRSSLASVGVVLGATLATGAALIFSTSGRAWAFTDRAWVSIAVSMSVGAVVLLAHAYRVRTSSRVIRSATTLGGAAVVLFASLTTDTRMPHVPSVTPRAASAGVVLRVPLVGQPECAQDQLTLPLEVTSPSAWRVELMWPRVDVSLADGSHVELSSERWMAQAGLWGPLPPSTGARVDGDSASTRIRRTDIVFDLPLGSGARVCGHVAAVALRIPMRVASPRELLRFPLSASSTASTSGYRGRLVSVNVGDTTVTIALNLTMLTSTAARRVTAPGELDYALAHPRHASVIRLSAQNGRTTVRLTSDGGSDQTNANGDPSDVGGERSDNSSVPGLTIMSSRLRLQRYDTDTVRQRDLRSWSDSAVLVVIAPQWHGNEVRTIRSVVPATTPVITATTVSR